jgi:hypothetical protein
MSEGLSHSRILLTDNETLHFVFLYNVHVQHFLHPIVELICSTSRRHNTQLLRARPIELRLCLLELLNEVDADIDAVRFEIEEV